MHAPRPTAHTGQSINGLSMEEESMGCMYFGGKLDADISDIIYRPLVRKVLND